MCGLLIGSARCLQPPAIESIEGNSELPDPSIFEDGVIIRGEGFGNESQPEVVLISERGEEISLRITDFLTQELML